MGKITLGGSIPGDNNDGLGPSSKEFLEHPLRLVNIVARVAVVKITTKPETQEEWPTLRIHHWEIVPNDKMDEFGDIIGTAYGRRTGFHEAEELPFADGQVPIRDPFPEEVADEATRAIENLENEPGPDGGGDTDELSARRPRARRRS